MQFSPVTGDCMLYDSIPGRTHIINDEPYKVHTYARVTLPGNCDGSTEITFDKERVDCDAGRQVGAPAAFGLELNLNLMAADANHSMWIGGEHKDKIIICLLAVGCWPFGFFLTDGLPAVADALSIDECDTLAEAFAATSQKDAFTVTYSMNTCGCLFPFSYDGVTYNSCTPESSPAGAWCATSPVCQSRFSSDPASICQLDLARRQEGAYGECRARGLAREEQICPSSVSERGCYVQLEQPSRQENLTGSNLTEWRSCQYQRYYYTETEDIPLRGLIAGIAGRAFTFRLTSRDEYGNVQNNPIYAQSDEYIVQFFSLNGTQSSPHPRDPPHLHSPYLILIILTSSSPTANLILFQTRAPRSSSGSHPMATESTRSL